MMHLRRCAEMPAQAPLMQTPLVPQVHSPPRTSLLQVYSDLALEGDWVPVVETCGECSVTIELC